MTRRGGKVKRLGRFFRKALDIMDKSLKGAAMTTTILPPEDCQTMTEVRAGVDALDQALVRLIARRYGYMDAAARIKTDRNVVRDEARKAQVLDNVEQAAHAHGLPAEDVRALWEDLVESSIAYELRAWDRTRA